MSAPEISPDEQDIPPGWPRAFYREPRDAYADVSPSNPVVNKYTQWTSESAADQITSCSTNRTWTAGERFACSSCAFVMERGLLLADTDPYSGQVGSPICFRCAVFAFTHCPDFRDNPDRLWHVVESPYDYYEVDSSGCLQPTAQGLRRRVIDRDEIFSEVRAGRLWLTETNVGLEPIIARPRTKHGTDAVRSLKFQDLSQNGPST